MMATIHQPDYIPWIGFFDRIDKSDMFIVLDNVQFITRGYHNRNRIKTPDGWMWLTVPVIHNFGQKISQVKIDNSKDWASSHLESLKRNYGKCEFFAQYIDFFSDTYEKRWELLVELNMHVIIGVMEVLGLKKKVLLSSSLSTEGKKNELLISACRKVGANSYLSGTGAKDYMEDGEFEKSGIRVVYQNFSHPEYTQRFGKFEPNMSIVDLLFNCGDKSMDVIRGGK
jgi:hypothetical protein